MTSKEDDDTLPLTRFSSELSADASVDEDFIPTSQPQSDGSCKGLKTSETNIEECDDGEERKSNGTSPTRPSLCATDPATVLLSAVNQSPEEDKSTDFIPDTETKKRKLDYSKEIEVGSKKLRGDGFVKCTEDIFGSESDSPWEAEVSKIPESPAVETQHFSITNETSSFERKADNGVSKNERNFEESVTEIIVNDSAETVDLDGSENLSLLRIKKKEKESDSSVGKIGVSCSFNSDVERCEETQIFDNSSILLIDQPEVSCQKTGNSQNSAISANVYLQETIVDKELSENENGASVSGCALPPVVKMSKESATKDFTTEIVDIFRQKENFHSHFENHPRPKTENFEPSSVETRKFEMKLSVSCMVTANIKTKQVLQKLIVNVNELPSFKAKSRCVEQNSDSASDKSKRQSTSSCGSVYSDKTGLPFALPKRVSTISDQTDASDSSDEWFSKRLADGQKVFERMPWTNEYLLPLKMDELIKVSIENQETTHRTTNMPSPRKFKSRNRNELNRMEEILESSSFEHSSANQTCVAYSKTNKMGDGENIKNNEDKYLEPPQTVKEFGEVLQNVDCQESDKVDSSESIQDDRIENADSPCNKQVKTEKQEDSEREESRAMASEQNEDDRKSDSIELHEGLPVFAKWTDKRYYSGVLSGTPKKNYRWDIKFDDGTSKTTREEFVVPTKWLKTGILVFALVDDKYQSGQITKVESGEKETMYVVELDSGKKEVTVKVSDLRLTEVMANIIRERYKPLNSTRGNVSSEIDFDNVIIGKRVREQRTPLKATVTTATSETGKKSSKAKKFEAKSSEPKETSGQDNPERKKRNSGNKLNGLRSENGHLVEDKVISGDSPSAMETKKTCKRTRGKAKPRSLTYEPPKNKEDKVKFRNWLTADGIPIPGSSGIKFKTKKSGSKKRN